MNTQIIRAPAFQRPSGKMIGPAQSSLATGNLIKMLINTIPAHYTDGIEDALNNRIIPGIAGFYNITANIIYEDPVADTRYTAVTYVTGVQVDANIQHASHENYLTCHCNLASHWLSAVDVVELYAQHFSGGASVNVTSSNLCVQRVR